MTEQYNKEYLKDYYEKEGEYLFKHGGQYFSKDEGLNFYFNTRYNMIVNQFPKEPKGRFLDIGAGSGIYSSFLLERGNFGVALDFSKKYIEFSKRLIESKKLDKRCNFVEANATSLPFKDDHFDIVLLLEVIEHIPEYASAISEAKRVLKQNGTLIVSIPLRYSYKEFGDSAKLKIIEFRNKMIKNISRNVINKEPPFLQHLHFFSFSEIADIMEGMGFIIEDYDFSCYFFPLFKNPLGKNPKAQTLYLRSSTFLSKTPFRNFAWNTVIKCINKKTDQ